MKNLVSGDFLSHFGSVLETCAVYIKRKAKEEAEYGFQEIIYTNRGKR